VASSRAMVWATFLWATGSPSQAPGVWGGGSRPIAGGERGEGVGRLAGFGALHGFGTRCWAIRLPITTKALPTSSLVPWIVALRAAPSSVDGPETAMQALEMSVGLGDVGGPWRCQWPV
jgi:hypothetical protein